MKLKNKRHEAFCLEYLKELNASKSYRAIYPDTKEDVARRSSSKLMTKCDIVRRIDELSEERRKRVLITVDEVLRDLIKVKTICLETEQVIETDEDGFEKETGKIKFEDRSMVGNGLKSVELLGRHVNMWKEKTLKEELTETIDDFIKRVEAENAE